MDGFGVFDRGRLSHNLPSAPFWFGECGDDTVQALFDFE